MRHREVPADFGDHSLLCAGQRESRAGEQSSGELSRRGDRPGRITADFGAELAQRELVGKQLLECEASLRGMAAGVEFRELASGGGR